MSAPATPALPRAAAVSANPNAATENNDNNKTNNNAPNESQ